MKIKLFFIFLFIFPVFLLAHSSAYYIQSTVDSLSIAGSGDVSAMNETAVFANNGILKTKNFFYYDFGIQNLHTSVYYNPINFAFKININTYSIFGGRIESSLFEEESCIKLNKHFLGGSEKFHSFYWGGKVLYYSTENLAFYTTAQGWGVSVGLMKILNKVRFGFNYTSPIYLHWTKNSDFILFNYLAPEFNIGMAYAPDTQKSFFLSLLYVFPQVRMSGDNVSRNVLLHDKEVHLKSGMRISYKLKSFTFSNGVGIDLFPDNQVGTVATGDLIVRVGLGFNIQHSSFPIILKIAYSQDFISEPMNVAKIGVIYNF